MRSTITDRIAEKQALVEQKKKNLLDQYPSLWATMIADWKKSDPVDAGWLIYSANYLFRTGGLRWAVDPLTLKKRLPGAPQMPLKRDLEGLQLVLLTHEHNDHLDVELIHELADLPIRWIIPRFVFDKIRSDVNIPEEKVTIPKVLQPITFQNMTILPFEGQHLITYANGLCKGVPEMGYLVEQGGKRWLFPGDTRVYDLSRFPKLGAVDALFAHLWLGHGCAVQEPYALLESFCSFCVGLQPKQVLLAHLEECGRKADDFYDETHVSLVKQVFSEKYPHVYCSSLHIGEKFLL